MATFGEILTRIRRELRDHPQTANAEAIGDGSSTFFQMPDYPIVAGTFVSKVSESDAEAVEDTDYELVEESGELTLTGHWLTTPPTDNFRFYWNYQFTRWSEAELMELVNSALRYVGQEYLVPLEDTSITLDRGTVEYAAPADARRLVKFEIDPLGRGDWEEMRHWKTRTVGAQLYLKLQQHPGEVPVRLTYLARPTPFRTVEYALGEEPPGWTSVSAQELSATGLPDEAYEPIVYYTIWMALERRINYRARDDAAQHEKEETTVTMRDLEARSARARMLFELHYEQFRTEYIHGRLVD